MPFISFTTNHKLTLRQENEIAKRKVEIAIIVSEIIKIFFLLYCGNRSSLSCGTIYLFYGNR